MTFWQSPDWLARTDSIYALAPGDGDPEFMPWWKEAWTLFRRRPGYDVVLTMGIRESFAYAFLCWVTGCRSRQIMTEVFIDTPQSDRWLWRVKTAFYRKLARTCLGIITNSTAEIETNAKRFQISRNRFRYVPLNTTIAEPVYEPRTDGYAFCAGRTLRDYATLSEVIASIDLPWKIVGGARDMMDVELPARVELYREINRDRYLELLRGARFVVLPLLPTERATGQVVLLEAMSYGKPVITTRAPGTVDIVHHGRNGFLVDTGKVGEIVTILNRLLAHPEECERVGRQALEDVQGHHTTFQHARERIAAIESLYAEFGTQNKPAKN